MMGPSDHLRFFRAWLAKPTLTGAVSPSGRALARAMAAEVTADGDWPVLELGPGTGPVTEALIERGVAPERIVAVEFSSEFCALLVDRFRGLNVVEGDAYDLAATLPPGSAGPYAAVVSSLPLLTRPPDPEMERRKAVLDLPGFSRRQIQRGFAWFDYHVYKGRRPRYKLLAKVLLTYVRRNAYCNYLYRKLTRSGPLRRLKGGLRK